MTRRLVALRVTGLRGEAKVWTLGLVGGSSPRESLSQGIARDVDLLWQARDRTDQASSRGNAVFGEAEAPGGQEAAQPEGAASGATS